MANWSAEQLAEQIARNPSLRVDRNPLIDSPKKASKYRNVKSVADGIPFDSKKEAARFLELKALERAGVIRALAFQPSYDLWVNNQRVCRYRADFTYLDAATGKSVVEDCKGFKTPAYRLKKKLMKAIHGIEILET